MKFKNLKITKKKRKKNGAGAVGPCREKEKLKEESRLFLVLVKSIYQEASLIFKPLIFR